MVPAFALRWVGDTMSSCFLLLIYHWRWIQWRGNPTLEAMIQKRLISIKWKQKNLRV
jgi:hypothetical protein